MSQSEQKKAVARAALAYLKPNTLLGVGTGSTVNAFIDALEPIKDQISGAVSSSVASTGRLQSIGIKVVDLADLAVGERISVYVDGADEADANLNLIKGGGGALTREKIVAASSDQFVCIVDESKCVAHLGAFAVPVEVIPMAQNLVIAAITALGGSAGLRAGFTTDNGNVILDIHGWQISDPPQLETTLNQITGVVCNGIFSHRPADILLIGGADGVRTQTRYE